LIYSEEAAWLLFLDAAELARVQSALTPTDFEGETFFRLSDLRQFTARVLKIYPFGAVPANDGGNWWY
jgi:hypothetical protein